MKTNKSCDNDQKTQCFQKFDVITLTISQQNYLKAVYELSPSNEGVHISDIAAKLEVAKSSTCVAMHVLEKKKFIYRDKYRQILLTQMGKQQAMLNTHKFRIIRQFLTQILHVEQEIATADACAMEHIINMETLCCLCRFIGYTEKCKHVLEL